MRGDRVSQNAARDVHHRRACACSARPSGAVSAHLAGPISNAARGADSWSGPAPGGRCYKREAVSFTSARAQAFSKRCSTSAASASALRARRHLASP